MSLYYLKDELQIIFRNSETQIALIKMILSTDDYFAVLPQF